MFGFELLISSRALNDAQGAPLAQWWNLANYSRIEEFIDDVEKHLKIKGDCSPEIICLDCKNDIFSIHEESGLDWTKSYFDCVQKVTDDEQDIFFLYLSYFGIGKSADDFRESYQGCFNTKEDYAYDYFVSSYVTQDTPKIIQDYFDYKAFAEFLFNNQFIFLDGYVFSLN